MSQVAGVVGKDGEDVSPLLLRAIATASPARADSYGFSTPSGVECYPSPPPFSGLMGSAALAYKLVRVEPADETQPLHQGEQAVAVLGRFDGRPSVLNIADFTRGGGIDGLARLLSEKRGPYAVVVAEEGRLLCCRDVLGIVPLYCGFSANLACVASNMRTLRLLGLEPRRVEPGRILELRPGECVGTEVVRLVRPREALMSLDDATEGLSTRLQRAAERAVRAITHPVLAFSGGIDSTLLALYLGRAGGRPRLTCIATEGSRDVEVAESTANALGMPLRVRAIEEGNVEEVLDAVLSSVEEANPVKVGVALPLYFVAEGAVSEGRRVVISGNMSDELFGGYAKYTGLYACEGGDAVQEVMFGDVARSHEANFERDWKVCADLGTELRVPYADPELVDYALSLPLSVKLPDQGRGQRKAVLRRLASRLGLSDEVAGRPKRAAQYSSGVQKLLEKLARRKGMTLSGYLSKRMEALQSGKTA